MSKKMKIVVIGGNPILGPKHFKDWLASQPKRSEAVSA